ncbi:hypothetical protein [Yinghuangia soli]|uniref:Uncharacterized protein n=1 Tax=Yinghuangia soli TaxID=2908204 RepID=A0AA41Q5H2_9ACTN|nr:hypothetical protein [Yinghuangia soli]MCF2531934.1 hypothetical protein [Yinghuangia soli]
MEGTTRPATTRQPLHQIVYRWQRQDLFGRKGLGPAATSLPVVDLARIAPDLAEAVAAEFGGDGAPLTSTSLTHVDSYAAVIHRVASEFEQGRLGNHAHVLLGTRAGLLPHAVLALDKWTWRGGQPPLGEIPVGRRLARVPYTILDDALADRAFGLRDAARERAAELVEVLAAVLRRPAMSFSIRLSDCGGDPVALLWGLFDLITVPLPGPLTFSTYETTDGNGRPRFVVVPRWPSQEVWSGRHRIDPDAEARTDVYRAAADHMVRRYVEADWDTMYPLLRSLQELRRYPPYDRAVEIRDRFARSAVGTGADFGTDIGYTEAALADATVDEVEPPYRAEPVQEIRTHAGLWRDDPEPAEGTRFMPVPQPQAQAQPPAAAPAPAPAPEPAPEPAPAPAPAATTAAAAVSAPAQLPRRTPAKQRDRGFESTPAPRPRTPAPAPAAAEPPPPRSPEPEARTAEPEAPAELSAPTAPAPVAEPDPRRDPEPTASPVDAGTSADARTSAEPEAFPAPSASRPAPVPDRPDDPPPSAATAERDRWKQRGVYDEDIDALEFAVDQIADGGADRAVAFVEDVVALAAALELADIRLLPYVAEHFPKRLDGAPKWSQRERQAVRQVLLHPTRYGDRLVESGTDPKTVRKLFERLVRVVLTLEKDPAKPLRVLAKDLLSERRTLAPYPVLDDVLRKSSWEPAYYQELGRRWAELHPTHDTPPTGE